MTLLAEIEDDKKKLEELENTEENQEEDLEDGKRETEQAEPEEDPDNADEPEEASEAEPEAKVNKEHNKEENVDFARLRREKAEAERKARESEERIRQLEEGAEIEQKEEVNEDAVLLQELKEKKEYEATRDGFLQIEANTKAGLDNYEEVSAHYANTIAQGIYALNPNLTEQQLKKAVEKKILDDADALYRQGFNPVEEMYHMAKEKYGYKPKSAAKEEIKPDLDKIAENRKRNAGTAAAQKSSQKAELTQQTAADMSVADWAKLPAAEKRRLMGSEE